MSVYVVEELVRRDQWLDDRDQTLAALRDKVAAKMVRTGVLALGATGTDIAHTAEVFTLTYCKPGKGSKMVAAPVERATHAHIRLEILWEQES